MDMLLVAIDLRTQRRHSALKIHGHAIELILWGRSQQSLCLYPIIRHIKQVKMLIPAILTLQALSV